MCSMRSWAHKPTLIRDRGYSNLPTVFDDILGSHIRKVVNPRLKSNVNSLMLMKIGVV